MKVHVSTQPPNKERIHQFSIFFIDEGFSNLAIYVIKTDQLN